MNEFCLLNIYILYKIHFVIKIVVCIICASFLTPRAWQTAVQWNHAFRNCQWKFQSYCRSLSIEPNIISNIVIKYLIIWFCFQDYLNSGFLFIQGTFYNDHRNANNIDYSECIRKWANEKNIGPLATAVMEQTTFNELKIKLGYPQVWLTPNG